MSPTLLLSQAGMVDGKSPKKSSSVKWRLAFNADRKFLGTMSPTLSLSQAGMVDGKSPKKSSEVKRLCLEFLGTMFPTSSLSRAGMVDGKSPKKSSAVKRRLAFKADHILEAYSCLTFSLINEL